MRGLAIALALMAWWATDAAGQNRITASAVVVEPLQARQVAVSMEAAGLLVRTVEPEASNTRVLHATYVLRMDEAGTARLVPVRRRAAGSGPPGMAPLTGNTRFVLIQVVAANS